MRKPLLFVLSAAAAGVLGLSAFRSAAPAATQYMQITTIESIVPAGLGRSRIIVTNPDGTQKDEEMENFYSLTGINFGNIKKNDQAIISRINQMEADGWQLVQTTVGVQSPSENQTGGIYMSRYLFKK